MSGFVDIDVHGMTVDAAVNKVLACVESAGRGVYQIRVIHGYHGGTAIKNAMREEFSYGRSDKVRRVAMGDNPGITLLILRDL